MTKFDEFLAEQNRQKQDNGIFDVSKRIDQFQHHVEELYSLIDNEWLQPYIENGQIPTGKVTISITEERLGTYPIEAKWIDLGAKRVSLTPIGTMLIGTNARIDISYQSKEIMIVRVGENIHGASNLISISVNGETQGRIVNPGRVVWKYIHRNGRLSYVTLNTETFRNLLMELTNENR